MYENHHLLRYFWNRMIENHAKVSILLPLLALFQFLDCRTKKSQKTIYIYLYYIYICYISKYQGQACPVTNLGPTIIKIYCPFSSLPLFFG